MGGIKKETPVKKGLPLRSGVLLLPVLELLLSEGDKALCHLASDRAVCPRGRFSTKLNSKLIGYFLLHLI
jgi:hypothetical protein